MQLRSGDEGRSRGERSNLSPFRPAGPDTRSERVREIRRRIADDEYRSAAVVEAIARRILLSREL
jgi:hypothetical protein